MTLLRIFPIAVVVVVTTAFLILLYPSTTNALQQQKPVALLTGASGRTGKIVTNLLLEKGFAIRIFCRNEEKAKQIFQSQLIDEDNDIEFCQGDISNLNDIQAVFSSLSSSSSSSATPLTHVIFMAGGEEADYRAVNYLGVAEFAKQAAAITCPTVEHFVVISSAWSTRPYSIASLLFNSIYQDTIPMASHYLGEQAIRRAAAEAAAASNNKRKFSYVILRAGGLNSDENYAKKYPQAVDMGLTYQQGDSFDFLGIAGRPGMSRSQLAHAVVAATTVEGQYTVEITGSGTNVDLDDTSVYQTLIQDDNNNAIATTISNNNAVEKEEEESIIMGIHMKAVEQLKQTAIAATVGGIALIGIFGWLQGLILLVCLDALILLVWSKLFANQQAT